MALDPPDSDERLFLRIVEAGSLKAAAEQLRVDPSAVSRRLASLEARLGQQLLRRSTRGSKPTEAGARYYEGLAPLIAEQDALEAVVGRADEEPRGRLRVTAPPEFGVRFVVPVLESLERVHPELSVALALGTGFANLAEKDLDVAIRIGRLADSSLRSRGLGRVPRTMVASPAYLEAHGEPTEPRDLGAHTFLGYLPTAGPVTFRVTTPSGGRTEVEVPRARFAVNSISTLVRMAEAGRGALYGPRWAVAAALEAGRLRELLPDYRFDASPVQAVFHGQRYVPAKLRTFIDAMAEALAAEPSLEPVVA